MSILYNPKPISELNQEKEEQQAGTKAVAELTELVFMQAMENQGLKEENEKIAQSVAELSALMAGMMGGM